MGDGSAALSNAATAAFLDSFSLTGTSLGSVNLSDGSSPLLTVSGSATSEGYISRSADGTRIAIPGYNAALGTGAVASTTTTTAPRVVNTYNGSAVTRTASFTTNFGANNIRSAYTADGNTAYAVGATSGVVYGPPETAVSTTNTNNRVVNSFNGNLYFSAGAGTRGIWQVGTGLPTAAGTTSTRLIDTTTTGSSYGFAISPDGRTVYVADDRATTAGGGIQKWTSADGTAGSFTLAGTFTALAGTVGARGLTVDFGGTNPVLYATTAPGSGSNALVSVTDLGSNFSDSFNVIATAGTNQAFRGVVFTVVPVPEPATVLAVVAVGLGALRAGRRLTASSRRPG